MLSDGPTDTAADASVPDFFGALQNSCTNAILIVDRTGRIQLCTPAAENILGLKSKKPSLPLPLRKLVRDCLADAKGTPTQRTYLPAKNRSPVAANAIAMRRGRTTDVIVTLQDLAPWQRAEEHLRRLNRLADIGTLSASSGHEIKNALVAVKTFLDLLLEKNRDAELSEVVQREMQRIDALVGQMMRFARPARPVFSAVRLHDVLNHSLRMVQHQLEGKLISLNRSFEAAPDAVEGDDCQLEQAFVNLFINALEAMGPNGSLKVATELVSAPATRPATKNLSRVRVTISDTGIGVSPENMRYLFKPFFTTKQNGTGLGLPITRRIVQEHRGDITVQSELNQGTTFSILLPVIAKNR